MLGKEKVRHKIRAPLRAILFDGGANNLAAFDRAAGFVVVAQPTIKKVPGQLLTDLRIARIKFWERLSGDVVEQFAIGAQTDFAGVFFGRFDIFL